jgi:hypothetical protein
MIKKVETVKYEYDPSALILNIKVKGKVHGGFIGQSAETQFSRLLETGVEIAIVDMSKSIKSGRIRRLRAIWNNLGIDKFRDAILEPYGVSSTADLTLEQLDELIKRFTDDKQPVSAQIRALRSDVLCCLNKLGIYATSDDWKAVNGFLMQPRISGKLLFNMSAEELATLNKKLHSILSKKVIVNAGDVQNWN